MDRASIERDYRAAEATLKQSREAASVAHEAIEQRLEGLDNEGVDAGGDDVLRTLMSVEDQTRGLLADAEDRRDTLLKLLSRDPIAPAIEMTRGDAGISAMVADPAFAQAQRVAEGGSNIGVLPSYVLNSRPELVRALRHGGHGFFAVGEGATGEGLVAIDQQLFPPVEIPKRQIRLLDLITIGATDSQVVRYGQQTVRTDAAAPAALGDAFNPATYTWTYETANVENIGQYVKAPRETLLDIPALQTLIEQQLVYGVLLEAESLVYSGDGESLDFTGIVTAATSEGYTLIKETNERRVMYLARAIAHVRTQLFQDPDGIVIHPFDLVNMLSEESTAGGFLLVSSQMAQEAESVWRLPMVVTPLATEGEVTVGNYKLGATLWVRSGAELQMSDSNEDDFLKRLITIRAEFRAAFAVQRPHAFSICEDF